MAPPAGKTCTRCKADKALAAFSRDRGRHDGHFPWCKECQRADQRDRRRRDPEKYRARDRARNRDQVEARRANRRRHYRNNPEAYKARSLARWRGLGSPDCDTIAYQTTLRRDPCSYCGAPCQHIDHIVAFDAGGANHWANLTAACAACNRSKSADSLLLFLSRAVAA